MAQALDGGIDRDALAADLRTIAQAFIATGLIVLVATLLADCALFGLIINGAHSLESVPAFYLATNLLPLALTFTALVALATGIAIAWVKVMVVPRDTLESGKIATVPSERFALV